MADRHGDICADLREASDRYPAGLLGLVGLAGLPSALLRSLSYRTAPA